MVRRYLSKESSVKRTGCPSISNSPLLGYSSPAMMRSRVVLPPPEGPINTRVWTFSNERQTESSTTCPLKFFESWRKRSFTATAVAKYRGCRQNRRVTICPMGLVRFKPVATPAKRRSRETKGTPRVAGADLIPKEVSQLELKLGGRTIRLTNLQKLFWPERGISKGDLLRYYAEVS